MDDKIPKLITKIIFVPLIFFMIYAFVFLAGIHVVDKFETHDNVFLILGGGILLANIFALALTFLLYFIALKFWNEVSFRRWYHYTHLLFLYLSGVVSAVISIESVLLNQKILQAPIDDNTKLIMVIFVIIISNYTIFNSLVFNDDFKLRRN